MNVAARILASLGLLSSFVYLLLLYIHLGFMVFQQPMSLQRAAMLEALRGLAAYATILLCIVAASLAVVTCLQQQRRGRASVLALLILLALLLFLFHTLVPSFLQAFGDTLGITPQVYTEVIPGFLLAGIALLAATRPKRAAGERD